MHNAPSVSYPVGRSLVAAALATAASLLGALVIGLWAAQSQLSGWRIGLACLAWLGAASISAWKWWVTPKGVLAWDGQAWTWNGNGDGVAADSGRLEVSLDLQHSLLVRWCSPTARLWLWLERRRRAERWDELRRAVYSRARIDTPPDANPGPAEP